jgi:small subunit ribosomal protein S15
MYLTPEVKQQIFAEHGNSAADTGSAESQVALFTHRIKHLTEHLKQNKKDLSTKRSLINLVGKRRKMLEYLKRQDIERYRNIIKKLGLRK